MKSLSLALVWSDTWLNPPFRSRTPLVRAELSGYFEPAPHPSSRAQVNDDYIITTSEHPPRNSGIP